MIPPFNEALETLIDTYVEVGTSLEDMIEELRFKLEAMQTELDNATGDDE